MILLWIVVEVMVVYYQRVINIITNYINGIILTHYKSVS